MNIDRLSVDLVTLADSIKDGSETPTNEQCARFAIACLIVGSEVKKYCQVMLAEQRAGRGPSLKAGDLVQWTSRDGRVKRLGTLIEWTPSTGTWLVKMEPDWSLPNGEGFSSWFKPGDLEKTPWQVEER